MTSRKAGSTVQVITSPGSRGVATACNLAALMCRLDLHNAEQRGGGMWMMYWMHGGTAAGSVTSRAALPR